MSGAGLPEGTTVGCMPVSGRIDAWVVSSPKLRLFASKYRIPVEVLAAIRVQDEEKLRMIAEAYRIANSTEYAQVALASRDAITLFGKPEALRVRERRVKTRTQQGDIVEMDVVDVTIKFKTVAVVWRVPKQQFARMAKDIDKFVENMMGWLLVKAVKREIRGKKETVTWWEVAKLKHLNVDEDRETAKKLVEVYAKRYDWPYLAALAAVFGYVPDIIYDEHAFPSLVARFTVIVGGPVAQPTLHGVELTLPGTGKTTMANLLDISMRWLYYAEPPSPASFLGDARTGWSPLSGADGVWLDEYDAWPSMKQRDDFKEVIAALLTGMEQGRWQRSKGGVKAPRVDRAIPLYFTGNMDESGCIVYRYRGVEQRQCFEEPREFIKWTIGALLPSKRQAFNERVAIAVMNVSPKTPVAIQEWTMARKSGRPVFGKPSVIRGLVNMLREEIAMRWEALPRPGREFENMRMQQRYEGVTRVLSVLLGQPGEPLEDNAVVGIAKKLVAGLVVK